MESTSRKFHSDTFLSDDDDDDATGGNNVRLETESDDIPVSTSRQHIPAGHSDLELEPNESQASYSAAPGIASFSQTSASTESHAKHAITQREQQSSITWSPKNDNQLRSVTSYEVPGTINGIPVEALPDWGSAIEAISEAFARQHGFSIDATGTQTIRLPGGNITESVGRVVGDFKFQRESDVYQCQFHVLRDSVFDLVLGRRFLDLTKTLTDFSHRIVERVRPCYQKGSRLFLMGESPKDRLRCVVNGFEASALPDTGSELMLCSGDFVRRHGFTVHKGKKYQRQVVLIDGSTMRTDGMVTGAELQFDAPPVSSPSLDCSLYLSFITGLASLTSCKGNAPRKATFICDLYVIESLPYDIILSNEFIFQYGVFSRFQHLFYSTSPSTSPDEQASVDNSLLFIRTRRPGRLSRRQPPQTETNTISFQGGLSWERRWEVEEARRNRAMLRIASLPEPQKKKDSSAGGFELLGVSSEKTEEQNSDLESQRAAIETNTPGGTNNSQHQHSNSKASDSPLQVTSEDEATLNALDADPDSNIVWWDGDDDPENPYNWPAWQKYLNCGLLSVLTFITPLASSIFAPGVPKLMVDFEETSQELGAFVVSVYVLGFAFGPMLMAPLSEVYGRTIVYHVCNILFVCFTVGCALAPNMAALIVFRFLAGAFGACPMTNGGGSISDMIVQEKRAVAMSAFSIGPLIGPILGPVVGGVLVDNKGWRWVFWVVTIIGGFLAVTMILTMRETYAPVILKRKTQRLIKETGNLNLRSKLDTGLSDADLFRRAIVRPTKLLIFSPICTIFAFYLMIVYGYLYLLFTSVPFIFQNAYGFSASTVGLVYLGLGVGSFVGLFWFSFDTNKQLQKMKAQQQDHKDVKPEVRLKLLPVGTLLLPIGFFIYGWTAEYETHWMAPIIGLAVIGSGNLICFMAVSMYLVDAYNLYAASALAANTVMRSIAGATLPLCALKMYDRLGLGWGNSLLAFIAIALLPIPILIKRYGEKLRTSFDNDRL
ncbi:hypothetical protein CDV31_010559 [Fusarium ambrosium]|uniref:Major facilitator superfamily (MFS) profile domain-containing protein n=1 Tax=Fusarium ambrosium TaxID=131363 RepID=A0A428TML1_9HYPO|nr:hypothetical protein CDV31_010559 [Fusarium ambrosium]